MTNHAAEAQAALDLVAGIWGEDLAVDELLAGAQVHATLALAEQQRIANLLAMASIQEQDFLGDYVDEIRRSGRHGLVEWVYVPATQVTSEDEYPRLRVDVADALGIVAP